MNQIIVEFSRDQKGRCSVIKITNGIVPNPNLKQLSDLCDGDTFLKEGDLYIMTDEDPDIMHLGGTRHGMKDDFTYSEAEDITVEVVDLDITVNRRPIPVKKVVKKKAKKKTR